MKKILFIIFAILLLVGGFALVRDAAAPAELQEDPATAELQEESAVESEQEVSVQTMSDTSTVGVQDRELIAGNVFFNPEIMHVERNVPVRLTVRSAGTHTFTIDELGISTLVNGAETIIEFTPTEAGTFTYYCAIPGHRAAGQVGTLIVE
jgi:nitrite reductase (NO-forming)